MLRRALLLAAGALALSCEPKPPRAPPPAPPVSSASDLVPADLDVVVRLDLGQVKAALGSVALATLSREALARGGQGEDELVLASLLEADVVYLAYRPSRYLMPLDRVLSLQGRFAGDVRPPPGFSGVATDLGGDVRFWERKPGPGQPRESVARIYAIGDRVRAFVSEAELDAVQRVASGRGAERRLEPPEEGTLSLVARPRVLARLMGSGSLRDLLEQAVSLQSVLSLEADGVALKLELVLGDAESAARLAAAAGPILARTVEKARLGAHTPDGRGPQLKAEGERVLLSAWLSRAELAPLLACWGGASASECPW